MLHLFIPVWNEIVMLPQTVHYWRSRVPGCDITLLSDCNADACSSDGTAELGAALGCAVLEWRVDPARAWRDADAVPFEALDFDGQVARLRARLKPLADAGVAAPGGMVGLEWLAEAAATHTHAHTTSK